MNPQRNSILVLFITLLAFSGTALPGMTGEALGSTGATTPPAPARLNVTLDAPDMILAGRDIDYTFTVSNQGEETAEGVVVQMALPAATEWVSGGEVDEAGLVTLPVGDLAGGEEREAVLSVHPIPPDMAPTDVFSSTGVIATGMNAVKSAAPQIIGGREADPGAWPWQVALMKSEVDDGYYAQFCGGSLIAPNWVLTAAHCISDPYTGIIVEPSSINVTVGRHVLSSDEGQRIATAQIVRHPDYNPDAIDSDVALLRLAQAVVYTTTIAPVTPLSPTLSFLATPTVDATVTGWGARNPAGGDPDYADALHQVSVPIVEQAVCQASYDAALRPGAITDNMICAGPEEGGRDSCFGDSGGPLVVPNGEGGWLQAGIVSWGIGCAEPGFPGVYTRVTRFYEWIEGRGRHTYTTPGPYEAIAANGATATGFDQLQTVVVNFDLCDDPENPECAPHRSFLPFIQQTTANP